MRQDDIVAGLVGAVLVGAVAAAVVLLEWAGRRFWRWLRGR